MSKFPEIDLEVLEVEITVEYNIIPASKGLREHETNLQLSPDTEEEVELIAVRLYNTKCDILPQLPEEEVKEIIKTLMLILEYEKAYQMELAAETKLEN